MPENNRIYPTWDQIQTMKNPLTEGEMQLLKYLDKYLPRDPNWVSSQPLSDYKGWLIFAQPYLNNTRPDAIIYHPYLGMVIYEVKDWHLTNYKWSGGKLFVSDRRGSYPILNPIDQVNHYKEKIIGQLVPIIGEAMDNEPKNFGLIKTALYFHKATTAEADEMFGSKIKPKKNLPIFGHDSLKENFLGSIVPEVNYTSSRYWKRDWNKELLFWLKPPYHSIEQGQVLNLKGRQLEVATPSTGHSRVRGVAGSGKTQALAYRAAHLASKNKRVLILSFNITLWHYIKDMIQRAPFNFSWEQITFNHFHGFCRDKLISYGRKWPKGPQVEEYDDKEEYKLALEQMFRSDIPDYVAQSKKEYYEFNSESVENESYDAVLIDEGQDYYYEWYALLSEEYLNREDELLIVCDKKQNIYERELDWLDKRVTRNGLEKFITPYIDLLISYRMPAIVGEMSNQFSELFNLNQDLKVGKIDGSPVLFKSQHIVWREITNDAWLENVYNAFRRLKNEDYHPSEMVILLPDHEIGVECVKFFKGKKIEVNHVFSLDGTSKYHKKSFYMGDSRLKISTIHSFKGWELLNIVLLIPQSYADNVNKLDAIVYTAITRTRENLIVLNINKRYSEFGKHFPRSWD